MPRPPTVRLGSAGVTFGFALTGAMLSFLLVILPSTNIKMGVLAAAAACVACALGAFVSGNVRLYCLWGLMFTLPLDLSKHFGTTIQKMGGENQFRIEASDPFILALLLYILREIFTGRRAGLRIPRVALVWLTIILLGCVPVIFGPYRTAAAQEVLRMLKVIVLFVTVCNELDGSPRRFLSCASAITASMILESIVGLVELYRHKLLGLDILGETGKQTVELLAVGSVEGASVFRISAFLRHPNLFGIFLAALLPLAIGCFLVRVSRTRKVLFLAGVLLGTPALIATQSRAGWAGFAVSATALTFLLLSHHHLRIRTIIPATVAAILIIGICGFFANTIVRRIFESREGATISRRELQADAWLLIMEKPWLGWDLNSYAFNVASVMRLDPKKSHKLWGGTLYPVVHNIYLLWWAELGIVGLLLHLWVWGEIIAVGIANLRVGNELLFIVNAACLSGILAFIPDGFFSFSLRMNAPLRLFWLLAAMMMAVRYWRLQDAARARLRRPAITPLPAPVPEPARTL